jgi:hypothetical protein
MEILSLFEDARRELWSRVDDLTTGRAGTAGRIEAVLVLGGGAVAGIAAAGVAFTVVGPVVSTAAAAATIAVTAGAFAVGALAVLSWLGHDRVVPVGQPQGAVP